MRFHRLPLWDRVRIMLGIPVIVAAIVLWVYMFGSFVAIEYDMHTRPTYPADVCVTPDHGGYVCGKPS